MVERDVRRRAIELVAGPRFSRRLAVTHALDDVADAFVNLSLAGSLFFSVSLDASRDRIMLYLVLAALPLVVAAPLIGPALDRSAIGYRAAIGGAQLVRAVVALALIGSLLSVALYPLAFLVLVCRKAYALAKTALLTQLTDDQAAFVEADAHITRTGTAAGGIGVIAAGVLLARDMTTVMLIVASVLFVAAALGARGLPSPTDPLPSTAMPALRALVPPAVWRATLAVTATRAAAGALTYLLAFAIKGGGGDRWIFAASLLAAGGGAVMATFLAPRLLGRLDPDGVLVLALLVPGVVSAMGLATVAELGVLAISFAVGLGNGVASRSIAALQPRLPTIARARTIARSELVFQLATLVGAGLAVQLAPAPQQGFAVTSVVLIVAGVIYARRSRHSLRRQASRLLFGDQAPAYGRSLPQALVAEAVRLASLGAMRMAIVVADNAVEIAAQRHGASPSERYRRLADTIATVKLDDEEPTDDIALEVIEAAQVELATLEPRRHGDAEVSARHAGG